MIADMIDNSRPQIDSIDVIERLRELEKEIDLACLDFDIVRPLRKYMRMELQSLRRLERKAVEKTGKEAWDEGATLLHWRMFEKLKGDRDQDEWGVGVGNVIKWVRMDFDGVEYHVPDFEGYHKKRLGL